MLPVATVVGLGVGLGFGVGLGVGLRVGVGLGVAVAVGLEVAVRTGLGTVESWALGLVVELPHPANPTIASTPTTARRIDSGSGRLGRVTPVGILKLFFIGANPLSQFRGRPRRCGSALSPSLAQSPSTWPCHS
jgi:hypothetical protein